MHLPMDGGINAGEAIVPKIAYATPFTIILVASSFTCQWGVFAAEKGDVFKLRRWFTLTFLMGLDVRARPGQRVPHGGRRGQHDLAHGYGSVFFLTEGFHGLHVIGGLAAFIFFLIRTTLGRFTPAQATSCHRGLLLLALRRRGVDRAVLDHLHRSLTTSHR